MHPTRRWRIQAALFHLELLALRGEDSRIAPAQGRLQAALDQGQDEAGAEMLAARVLARMRDT